jgi:hypothetical protein
MWGWARGAPTRAVPGAQRVTITLPLRPQPHHDVNRPCALRPNPAITTASSVAQLSGFVLLPLH